MANPDSPQEILSEYRKNRRGVVAGLIALPAVAGTVGFFAGRETASTPPTLEPWDSMSYEKQTGELYSTTKLETDKLDRRIRGHKGAVVHYDEHGNSIVDYSISASTSDERYPAGGMYNFYSKRDKHGNLQSLSIGVEVKPNNSGKGIVAEEYSYTLRPADFISKYGEAWDIGVGLPPRQSFAASLIGEVPGAQQTDYSTDDPRLFNRTNLAFINTSANYALDRGFHLPPDEIV